MILCPLKGRNIEIVKKDGGEEEVSFLNTYITQGFGMTSYAKTGVYGTNANGVIPHNGVDFRASTGTMVFAPFSGVVSTVVSSKGYGNHIRIKNDKWECVLAHLSDILVKNGQIVSVGDAIAKTGNTGSATAPHLHFGVRPLNKDGTVAGYDNTYFGYINPLPLIIEWYGTITNQLNYTGLPSEVFSNILSHKI